MSNTPYDDVFRTLLNDCTSLVLPLVNEVFHENYAGDEEIVFSPNEHFMNRQGGDEAERITDTCFAIHKAGIKQYHFECQSTADSSLLVRIFEYASQIALDGNGNVGDVLEVSFPHSAVLFLRHTKSTPDAMKIRITTPGGLVEYEIPVIKMQEYSLEELFGKNLLFLIPFYIFSHESRLEEYDEDNVKLEKLKQEYAYIRSRLERLCREHAIDEYTKCTIIDMTNKVVEHLASKYSRVVEGVKEEMGGQILDYEAKRIRRDGLEEGISQGIQQTLIELVHDGLLTVEEAAKRLGKNIDEVKVLL